MGQLNRSKLLFSFRAQVVQYSKTLLLVISKLSHVPNNGHGARIRGTEVRPATQAGQGPGRDAWKTTLTGD
jgi:hypothetical protein